MLPSPEHNFVIANPDYALPPDGCTNIVDNLMGSRRRIPLGIIAAHFSFSTGLADITEQIQDFELQLFGCLTLRLYGQFWIEPEEAAHGCYYSKPSLGFACNQALCLLFGEWGAL